MEFRNPGAVIEESIRVRELRKFFTEHEKAELLIDLGCGTRPYRGIYEKHFHRTIGIEHPDSPFPKSGIDLFCKADDIRLPDSVADVVLTTEMLHDAAEPLKVLREINRILKPGGTLLLSTPFLVPIVDGQFDHYRYTKYGLEYLLNQSDFEDIHITPVGDIFAAGITLFIKPWQRCWNVLAKKTRLKLLYSNWNPLFAVTVTFPQLMYFLLNSLPGIRQLFLHFNYGSLGYFTLARKKT